MFGLSFTLIASVVVLVLLLLWFYSMYVTLIKKRNKVREAMSGVDVQLKKRYDLIPNILTIANKFMEHERDLITSVTELRVKANSIRSDVDTISEKIKLDNMISEQMKQILVSVENYPQLKSDATMVQAQQTYAEVEEHIAAARRFYNSAVNDLNNSAEIFPSSVIASIIGVRSCPFFEAEESARQSVNASDYFYKK